MVANKTYIGTATKYAIAFVLAVTLLAPAASAQAAGKTKTLTGTVSDVMCGAKHKMAGASAAECTTKCASMGSKYALVVGSKVYELDGKTAGLDKLAGQKVKVSGTVDGNKLEVDSFSPAT